MFPVEHYSASSLIQFGANPILFKIRYINRDVFETAGSISSVIGRAFHNAMEVYYGGSDMLIVTSEAEAIEYGLKSGTEFLENYNDGFIEFSDAIPNKQKAYEKFAFAFNSYIQEMPYRVDKVVAVEQEIIEPIDLEWKGQRLALPVKLKGYIDRVEREEGKLKIVDYKTCNSFSNPDKIDAAKMIQAVVYYFLAYAKYGEEPYSLTFQEVKHSKNREGGKQVQEYEIVFAENELYFDFFFRYYEDVTRALNGEQVYVPNVHALYDNEVAIISYIHRLDIQEEKAALMKKHKVDNITDLLRKEMHSASNMQKLLKTVEEKFISAKSIDYSSMKPEERIKTKLMEHGMLLQYEDVVNGASVDLYRFAPSIGLKMAKLKNYVEDIEQVLGVSGVRILAPIPHSTSVGFEVPRKERSFPTLAGPHEGFNIAIGQGIMGEARRFDIRTAPHVLVAGASGQGKSVCLKSLIEQLLGIGGVDLHLYDPKRVELSKFKALAADYKCSAKDIWFALKDLENEMNARYLKLEKAGKSNIQEMQGMAYKFVVIDEFGQLIVSDEEYVETTATGHVFSRGENAGMPEMKETKFKIASEIERLILSLSQMGRAAGIHLIIATQRPSVDVIKGTIKANFPVKLLFKTSKATDSFVVIDEAGGEKLMGKGDMLFMGDNGIERLQGYMA